MAPSPQRRLGQVARATFGRVTSRARSSGLEIALLAALTAAASSIRLGERSLTLDEAFSAQTASSSWQTIWNVVTNAEANGALYYFVLHVWVVLGDSEAVLRSLSVVFAALTVWLTYALGSRLFGARTALLASVLLATNAFLITHAQNARAYTLAACAATAATYAYERAVTTRRRSWRWAYAVVASVALYCHFFAALVVCAHAVAALLHRERRAVLRLLVGPWTAVVATAVPLVAFVALRDEGQIDWIATPTVRDVWSFAIVLAGGSIVLWVLATIGVAGAARMALSFRADADRRWPYVLVGAWLTVPVGLALALSLARPVFAPRFLIVVLPAFAMLVAVGVTALPRRVGIAVAGGLIAFSLITLVQLYGTPSKQYDDWRRATEHILVNARTRDGIVFYKPHIRIGFDYYARRTPVSPVRPVSLYQYRGYGYTGEMVPATWEPVRSSTRPRLWLVLRNDDWYGRSRDVVRRQFALRYTLVERCVFRRLTVELYMTRSARPSAGAATCLAETA